MREISKSLVFIACLDNTPGYRQGLRAKGSSAVLPFPGGAHGSAGWGHGGRWARGVTQPASGEQAVLIFPLLLSCRWMSLLFQKSEINSREFLGNRGFWICHAYESAESTGKWGFFFCTWSHILTETKRKKKKRERETWESVGIRAGYCVTEIFHFRHKLHTVVCGPKKAERDSRRAWRNNASSFNPKECVQILGEGCAEGLDQISLKSLGLEWWWCQLHHRA